MKKSRARPPTRLIDPSPKAVQPQFVGDISERGTQHAAAAADADRSTRGAAARPDERTRFIQRQHGPVLKKALSLSVLAQVLLDVREIEGRDCGVDALQVRADRANGFGAAKVANDGDK